MMTDIEHMAEMAAGDGTQSMARTVEAIEHLLYRLTDGSAKSAILEVNQEIMETCGAIVSMMQDLSSVAA